MTERAGALYDVFISYADADRAWVEGYLLDALTQAGLRCHTEAAFALGAPLVEEFERAIQQSRRTVLVLSPAYQADNMSRFADRLAQSFGADTATWPVIPLILQRADLPPRLRMLVSLDASDPARWPAVVERLLADLSHSVPAAPPPPPCPYPGMAPFTEADSGRFYGRETEVEGLVERLRLHPFLAIIGPSGSGKSSLAFAGLLPALRASRRFGPGEWDVRAIRPGATPLETLRATVGDAVNLETFQRTDAEVSRLLLVVDQFEEVFTQRSPESDEADVFQSTLARLADLPPAPGHPERSAAQSKDLTGCYVVLTVRADFFADLLTCPLWPQIKDHRCEVLPLDAVGLRQAIMRPAEDVGVYVEAALVERLIADAAGEPGVLPFVQETLALLWEHLERRFLPLRAYEALVLPSKAYQGASRTGLQVAMARRADAALAALSEAQQAIARRIFLRLVQFGEGRADTRRQQPGVALSSAHDSPGEPYRTLEHLVRNRLLTLSGEVKATSTGKETSSPVLADDNATYYASRIVVDIAHESLITGWPTLKQWVQEGRAAELTRRQIEWAAEEWNHNHRDSSYLYRGIRLVEAQVWAASSVGELSDLVRAFLTTSQHRADLLRYARLVALSALVLLAAIPPFQWTREYLWRRAASGPMATFQAGEALLGSNDDSGSRAYPQREVDLPAFSIDLHEVTYKQYRLCVKAGRCSLPLEPAGEPGIENADERLPVVWVTAYQAVDFCRWLGRRLPSEAEWERAARGTDGRAWPWPGGEEPTARHVNLFLPNYLQDAPTGPVAADDLAFAAGVTPEGVMHLVGNVWEWTRTSHLCADTPYDCLTLWNEKDKVQALFLRGMSWTHDLAPVTYSLDVSPLVADIDKGFRCAQSEGSRR